MTYVNDLPNSVITKEKCSCMIYVIGNTVDEAVCTMQEAQWISSNLLFKK